MSENGGVRSIIMEWARDPLNEVYADIEPLVEAISNAIIAAKAAAWDEGGEAAIEREHTYGAEEKAKFSNPYRTAPREQ